MIKASTLNTNAAHTTATSRSLIKYAVIISVSEPVTHSEAEWSGQAYIAAMQEAAVPRGPAVAVTREEQVN